MMSISAIGATTLRIYPQYTNPASVAGPGFAQSLTVAAGPDAGTSASSGATTGADTSVAEPNLDYTHMKPHQLYAASKELLNAGKITMDEGFQMQLMSGEFATNGVSNGDETPVNYVQADGARTGMILIPAS